MLNVKWIKKKEIKLTNSSAFPEMLFKNKI